MGEKKNQKQINYRYHRCSHKLWNITDTLITIHTLNNLELSWVFDGGKRGLESRLRVTSRSNQLLVPVCVCVECIPVPVLEHLQGQVWSQPDMPKLIFAHSVVGVGFIAMVAQYIGNITGTASWSLGYCAQFFTGTTGTGITFTSFSRPADWKNVCYRYNSSTGTGTCICEEDVS